MNRINIDNLFTKVDYRESFQRAVIKKPLVLLYLKISALTMPVKNRIMLITKNKNKQKNMENENSEELSIHPPQARETHKGLVFAVIAGLVVVSAGAGYFVFTSSVEIQENPPALEFADPPPNLQGLMKKDLAIGDANYSNAILGFDEDEIAAWDAAMTALDAGETPEEPDEENPNPLSWEGKIEHESTSANSGQIWLTTETEISYKDIFERIEATEDIRLTIASFREGNTWTMSDTQIYTNVTDDDGTIITYVESIDLDELDSYMIQPGESFMIGSNVSADIYGLITFEATEEELADLSDLPDQVADAYAYDFCEAGESGWHTGSFSEEDDYLGECSDQVQSIHLYTGGNGFEKVYSASTDSESDIENIVNRNVIAWVQFKTDEDEEGGDEAYDSSHGDF
jgi:hypothetical protein